MSSLRPHINVCLMQPPGYIHALALLEAAEYVVAKSREVGFEASLSKNRILPTGLNIVFGAHINPKSQLNLGQNVVIFNSEQLPEQSAWINADYKEVLNKYYIWDYSDFNLVKVKHDRKQVVCFRHVDALNRLVAAAVPEYDLVFYGSLNDRRKKILNSLREKHGLKVLDFYGLYGPERDVLLANTRALLNLHFYDSQIFQQIRAFYPLINGIPVVSENFPAESAPAIYQDTVFTPGAEPFEVFVAELLQDHQGFAARAQKKIDAFRGSLDLEEFSRALTETVREVLGDSRDAVDDVRSGVASVPTRMNIGSGKDYRPGYLNVDINRSTNPDLVFDLTSVSEFPVTVSSHVYGEVVFSEASLDEIVAIDVLEHVPDLERFMTHCLALLKEGGRFEILVPYDLSHGAWQDPTHVRAFNEHSWLYYTEWFWYLGWFEYRFDCLSLEFVPSEAGQELIKQNLPQPHVLRTPRAINSMKVSLIKRRTTPAEKTSARSFRAQF
jgi:SAM-dependent methyltransferase